MHNKSNITEHRGRSSGLRPTRVGRDPRSPLSALAARAGDPHGSVPERAGRGSSRPAWPWRTAQARRTSEDEGGQRGRRNLERPEHAAEAGGRRRTAAQRTDDASEDPEDRRRRRRTGTGLRRTPDTRGTWRGRNWSGGRTGTRETAGGRSEDRGSFGRTEKDGKKSPEDS